MLKVNEMFETIQGEAEYTGTPSVFVRLQGCEVGCAFCDTPHTWAIDARVIPISDMKRKVEDEETCSLMSAGDIVVAVSDEHNAKHVVITGGEPCIYDLNELTQGLIEEGFSVQIETSGTEPIRCAPETFVTLSPKFDMAGGKEVLIESFARADEIKMPVGRQRDIDNIHDLIVPHGNNNIWLQPLSQSTKATALCVAEAIKNNWRVSIQTHKYMGVR